MAEGVAVVIDGDARRAILHRASAKLAHDAAGAVFVRRAVLRGIDGALHVQVLDDGFSGIHIAEQTRGRAAVAVVERDGVAVTVEVAGEGLAVRHDFVRDEVARQLDVLVLVRTEFGAERDPIRFVGDGVRVAARTASPDGPCRLCGHGEQGEEQHGGCPHQ